MLVQRSRAFLNHYRGIPLSHRFNQQSLRQVRAMAKDALAETSDGAFKRTDATFRSFVKPDTEFEPEGGCSGSRLTSSQGWTQFRQHSIRGYFLAHLHWICTQLCYWCRCQSHCQATYFPANFGQISGIKQRSHVTRTAIIECTKRLCSSSSMLCRRSRVVHPTLAHPVLSCSSSSMIDRLRMLVNPRE